MNKHPNWFKSYIRQQYLMEELPKEIEKVKKDIAKLKEDMKEKNGNKVE
jgi:ribosomal protein L29